MRFSKTFPKAYSETLFKNSLLEGKNLILTENGVAARPGVSPIENPVIFSPQEFSSGYSIFNLTDIYINIDNLRKRIAVCIEDDGYSNIYYHVFAIYKDGKEPLGTITFTRISYDSFGLPASYLFFEGRPTVGSGIYFLARIVYEGSPDSFCIYELSRDRTSWLTVMDSAIYTPTLLINGRGFAAEKAIKEGLNLPKPIEAESLNMLGEKYHAQFTSDGHSFIYYMPKYPIIGKIECALTLDSGITVNWIIDADQTKSQSIEIDGVPMSLRCVRETGQIITDSDEKLCVPLRFFGLLNNLRFTVFYDRSESVQRVCSLTECRRIFADTSSLSGAVTVFSGSSLYPCDIIWNSPENPLYFPEKSRISLSGPVQALCTAGGNLLAFEKDSISSLRASLKQPAVSFCEPSINMTVCRKSNFNRVIIPKTVAESNDLVYFCCDNGEIFFADSTASHKSIGVCKDAVENAVTYEDKYLLISDKKIFAYDPRSSEKTGLLGWELPTKILSATDFDGKTVFFADGGSGWVFGFSLYGSEDRFMTNNPAPGKVITRPIEAEATALLYEDIPRCRLHEIMISTAQPVCFEAELLSGGRRLALLPFKSEVQKLCLPAIFRPLSVKLNFRGGAEFLKVKLKYSKLTKL